jgi:hypothetical protein
LYLASSSQGSESHAQSGADDSDEGDASDEELKDVEEDWDEDERFSRRFLDFLAAPLENSALQTMAKEDIVATDVTPTAKRVS